MSCGQNLENRGVKPVVALAPCCLRDGLISHGGRSDITSQLWAFGRVGDAFTGVSKIKPRPFGVPWDYARGFGKTGQSLSLQKTERARR